MVWRFTSGLAITVVLIFLLSFSPSAYSAQIEDIAFVSHGVTLAGSVVLPEDKPIAALILVHGAGPEERSTNLARFLASNGFAVLTYDKRGAGKSGGQFGGLIDPNKEGVARLNLLADDAVAAAQALVKHPGLEAVPLGFVGISEAGWVVPIAATRNPKTKFIALWGGPVCTVSEQYHFQFWAMNEQDFWKTHTKEQVADYMKSAPSRTDDIDPQSSLSKISVPGLWLFGDEDNIVPVDFSVTRLESLIRQGHGNFEYSILPGGHRIGDTRAGYASMVSWIKRTVANLPMPR